MRHELKYVISPVLYQLLKARLKPFMRIDSHAGADGKYFIRSIYFDSFEYKAQEEKKSGIDERKKFRLRFYNGDAEGCRLECKVKKGTRVQKQVSEVLAPEILKGLLEGTLPILETPFQEPLGTLFLLERMEGYRPAVVVDYIREAYIYPVSSVRITFDQELAAGRIENCLSRKRYSANVLPPGYMILEVKYDMVLPGHISEILSSARLVREANSKYVLCLDKKRGGYLL